MPVAWEIVTYAWSYGVAHIQQYGWGDGRDALLLARTLALNVGFPAGLALLPAVAAWLLHRSDGAGRP